MNPLELIGGLLDGLLSIPAKLISGALGDLGGLLSGFGGKPAGGKAKRAAPKVAGASRSPMVKPRIKAFRKSPFRPARAKKDSFGFGSVFGCEGGT